MNPFDYVKSINNKDYMLGDNMSGYDPYLTNHALSAHIDCVLYANELNRFPDLPNHMQYEFYYWAIRKGNRYEPWLKKNKNETYENVRLVSIYYGINMTKAKETLDILTGDQLECIRQSMDKGGR